MSNVLRAYQVIEQDGTSTINSTYNVLDDQGNVIKKNAKDSFYVVPELQEHLDAIKNYIKNNRLNDTV